MKIKNLLKLSCTILLYFLVLPAMAQNKVVTGKVTDSKDGSTMPGVSVGVKGTTIGVTTNTDGSFSLSVPSSATTLVFSFIGYDKQEVSITDKSSVNVALVPNSTSLNEVVVVSVGYGTQRKKDVTGAISSISSKDFNQGLATNGLQQIQGKVPGLVITNPGGDPNASPAVRVRGQTSITGNQNPLIVIDGVALDDPNQFRNIPPGDIETIDVLKDASATAIYGARGSNGVLLVTMKKGRASAPSITYDGYYGVANQSKYYDLLSTSQYLSYVKNLIAADPSINLGTYDKGGSTDWQKAVVRTAHTQSSAVSMSGGSGTFNYRASLSYLNQQGIEIQSDRSVLGLRFNAEQKALDNKLDITMGITYSNIRSDGSNDNGASNVNYDWVFNTPPTYPLKNADGSYYGYSLDYNGHNPVQHVMGTLNRNYEYLTIMNATANYTIMPGLLVGLTGSTSPDRTLVHHFESAWPGEGNINNGHQQLYEANSYKGNLHINYDKSFGKHSISATAVYEYNDFFTNNFYAYDDNFLAPDELDNNLGAGNPQTQSVSSAKDEYKLISYLARVAYNYDGRFYVTASIRRDGSSKFGANHEWGNFPAVDVAWRLKRDVPFLNDFTWIDDIKIRGGYGVTGNADAIGPYSAIGLYGTGNTYYNPSNSAFPYPKSYVFSQNPNPDLRWEQKGGVNIGIDFSLFNSRLSGDIDYYNNKTTNMLYNYNVPTPPFLYNSIEANVGSLTNKGVDIGLTGRPLTGQGLNWTVAAQIAFVKTRVTQLSGTYNGYSLVASQIALGSAAGRGLSSTPITYLKPGYAPVEFYLPHLVVSPEFWHLYNI